MKTAFLALVASAAACCVNAVPMAVRSYGSGTWGPAPLKLLDPTGTVNHTISFNGYRDAQGNQILTQKGANGGPAREEKFYLHYDNLISFAEGFLMSANGYLESVEYPGRCVRARTFNEQYKGATTHFSSQPCVTDKNDPNYAAQFFFIQGNGSPYTDYFVLNTLIFTGDPTTESVTSPSYKYQLATAHETVQAGYSVNRTKAALYFDAVVVP